MKKRTLYVSIPLAALVTSVFFSVIALAKTPQITRLSSASLSLCASHLPVRAQVEQSTKYKPIAKRDAEAMNTLGRAIAKLGGPQTIAKMSSVTADGTATEGERTQPVHWEAKANSFRMETGTQIFASNGNVGWRQNNGEASKVRPHVWASTIMPLSLGAYLSEAYTNPTFTVQESADRSDERTVALFLRNESTAFTHALCTHYWYFDRETGLPTKVEFQQRSLGSPNFYIWTTLSFGEFTATEGVYSPIQFTYDRAGLPPMVIILSSLQPGVPLDDSRFALPTGATK